MVDSQVARAIADMACFLEFTDQSLLDQDASVAALEQLSHELGHAADEAKASLAEALLTIAPSYGERAEFVSSLPETLGII